MTGYIWGLCRTDIASSASNLQCGPPCGPLSGVSWIGTKRHFTCKAAQNQRMFLRVVILRFVFIADPNTGFETEHPHQTTWNGIARLCPVPFLRLWKAAIGDTVKGLKKKKQNSKCGLILVLFLKKKCNIKIFVCKLFSFSYLCTNYWPFFVFTCSCCAILNC